MNDPSTLRRRLEQAADDSRQPLTTDVSALLDRARADRHRRRRTTAVACLVTATALVGTTLGVRLALPDDAPGPRPDGRDPLPTSAPAASRPVPAADILERCLPQLQKYADLPTYAVGPPAKLRLTHPDREYVSGDVVSIQDRAGDGNPMLCLLPEPGREDRPVPFATFEPDADDPALIAEVCSETMLPEPTFDAGSATISPGTGPTPDLREASVDAVASAGRVLSALLSIGGDSWQCSLSPRSWDAGIANIDSVGRGLANVGINGSTTGSSNKSIVVEDASYYYTAGWLPRNAARLEVSIAGAGTFSVPVVDGAYAIAHKEPGVGGLQETHYRVLDAAGEVLYEEGQ